MKAKPATTATRNKITNLDSKDPSQIKSDSVQSVSADGGKAETELVVTASASSTGALWMMSIKATKELLHITQFVKSSHEKRLYLLGRFRGLLFFCAVCYLAFDAVCYYEMKLPVLQWRSKFWTLLKKVHKPHVDSVFSSEVKDTIHRVHTKHPSVRKPAHRADG